MTNYTNSTNFNDSSKNLIQNLTIDVIAGTFASFIISPWITSLDKALIENANGKHSLIPNLREMIINILRNPLTFIKKKEFLLIHGLYTFTYITANSIDTISEKYEIAELYETAELYEIYDIYTIFVKYMIYMKYINNYCTIIITNWMKHFL